MNILERAKKLVCDMNPHEAQKLNMLDGRSVQTWPDWAQRDFRLACDAMVAACEYKASPPKAIWLMPDKPIDACSDESMYSHLG